MAVATYQKLTARKEDILRWIVVFIQQSGWPPSIREIGEEFGIGTLNGAVHHLDALQRKGYISRSKLPRSIRVLHPAYAPGRLVSMVPLLKRAVGPELLGEDNVDRMYPVSSKLVGNVKGAFIVMVMGRAMAHHGLLPRDLAICCPQASYSHGDAVAFELDGHLFVREFQHAGDGSYLRGDVDHTDIDCDGCRVLGRVVGMMRDYEGEAF